jgi:hypothetical protein
MVSIPTFVCMSTHRAWALMRAEARGPSATLIASTSFSLQNWARSRICPGSAPFGGSSSTETTNCFSSFRARADFCARSTGVGASRARVGGRTVTSARLGWSMRTDRTRFLMCAGAAAAAANEDAPAESEAPRRDAMYPAQR